MDARAFLKLMGYLESTDGTNTEHPIVTSGPAKGKQAIGKYGMMPDTLQDAAKGIKQPTPLDDVVKNVDSSGLKQIMEDNPDKYDQYSKALADKVLTKTQGDPATAAAGWLYGQNRSPSDMKDILTNDPEYKARIDAGIMQKHLMSSPETLTDKLPMTPREQLFSKIREKLEPK